jgi:endo-1,4-beta-xylanase
MRGMLSIAAMVAPSLLLGAGTSMAAYPEPLRQAVNGRFLIGTAISTGQLQSPEMANFIGSEFNCITAENEFKPDALEPKPGKFQFAAADKLVAFAEAHHMNVVGHNLCWHNQTPAWMFQDESGNPLPREKALENLKRHIDGAAGHFKGKVIGWDVVNEAISDNEAEYLRPTPALKAIGDDYIAKAFEYAHAADPGAQLYYNDYSIENPDKLAKTIRLIRDLKCKGVHIDAVGIQGHFMLLYPDTPTVLDNAIKAFSDEGVKVMLTELDLEVLPRETAGAEVTAKEKEQAGMNPYPEKLPADIAQAQADFYAKTFRVVLKYPRVITRVTFWGTDDGHSWLNDWPMRGRTNHALLWDRNLQPKPAFDAVMHVLTESNAAPFMSSASHQ